MSENFNVEIITPEKTILKAETSEVSIPSYEGELGILKDHISLITFLRPGVIIIQKNKQEKYFIEEGTVEFKNNNLLILTSTIINLENLELNLIDEMIKKTEEKMLKKEINDKEIYLLSYKIDTLKQLRN
tara:strand:+ start:460 stop:849 length:390 start_codon:yes stop_codon:yes gene_type:complete